VADGYACVYKYCGCKNKELLWYEWRKLNELLEQAKKKEEDCEGKITKLWNAYVNKMKDQYCSQIIETLIDNYQKIFLDVRRESYHKFLEKVTVLAELLSNYIDLLPEKSE